MKMVRKRMGTKGKGRKGRKTVGMRICKGTSRTREVTIVGMRVRGQGWGRVVIGTRMMGETVGRVVLGVIRTLTAGLLAAARARAAKGMQQQQMGTGSQVQMGQVPGVAVTAMCRELNLQGTRRMGT
jgi:hypothetical protein